MTTQNKPREIKMTVHDCEDTPGVNIIYDAHVSGWMFKAGEYSFVEKSEYEKLKAENALMKETEIVFTEEIKAMMKVEERLRKAVDVMRGALYSQQFVDENGVCKASIQFESEALSEAEKILGVNNGGI